MSLAVAPAAARERAAHSAHISISRLVYPTTVALPVVPLEAWMRWIISIGTANSP